MYTFESVIRYSETDHNGILTLPALLDYFQDCSVFHSENAGVGYRKLLGERIAWVINAWQIQVKRYPALCEEVLIGTQPYELRGFLGLRNFLLKTKAGETLAVANSVWSLVNLDTLMPIRIPEDMLKAYPLSEKLEMDYAPRKLPFPQEGDIKELPQVKVVPHHLDTNDHVNNGQYIKIAMDFLAEGEVKQLRAEYHRQAFLDDVFHPRLHTGTAEDGAKKYTVSLDDASGKPYCVIELTY